MDTLLKWYKALRGDPKLRAWAVEILKRKTTRYHAWASIAERNLSIIEAKQEPN
jgi:hypothetical protein